MTQIISLNNFQEKTDSIFDLPQKNENGEIVVNIPMDTQIMKKLNLNLLKLPTNQKREFVNSVVFQNSNNIKMTEEENRFVQEWYNRNLDFGKSFEKDKKMSEKEVEKILKKTYNEIINVLKEYTDLRSEYYSLISVWTIGSYAHDCFSTYPYLFFNAMRGSGKTRVLKLIKSIAYNGTLTGSPTESVLFRMPQGHTLCIDEFEGITRKGNEGLREILNSSYKKGMTIKIMKKVNNKEGTTYEVEEFEPYKPICLANIWGMEEVLGDRCITLILEKSNRQEIMKIIEDFDENPKIKEIKENLMKIKENNQNMLNIISISQWNKFIKNRYGNGEEVVLSEEEITIFNKVDKTNINGRNLELFFPLISISKTIGVNVFEIVLKMAEILNQEKKNEELSESKDVALIEFVSQLEENSFIYLRDLTILFRNYIGDINDKDDAWLNEKWLGRALKRLNLVLDKRRLGQGNQITLNIEKAKDKFKIFGRELTEEEIKRNEVYKKLKFFPNKFFSSKELGVTDEFLKDLERDGYISSYKNKWRWIQ